MPTYDWEGAAQATSIDALVSGSLGFTPQGCTVLYLPDQPESVRPVVFPDAAGVRYANGVRAVVHETSGRRPWRGTRRRAVARRRSPARSR